MRPAEAAPHPALGVLAVLLASAAAHAQAPALAPTSAHPRVTDAVEADFVAGRRQATLQETLALAAKNSPDLRAARAQAAQVAAKAGLVYSAILPELKLTATYVHTSAPQVFDPGLLTAGIAAPLAALAKGIDYSRLSPQDLAALQPQPAAAPITLVAQSSLYGTGTISQVIFSPQFFLLPAADESREAARLGSVEAKEQVLLAVARVYLGLEGLFELEKAARDAEAVALKRERDASNQLAVGTATEIALLRAQSETAQARSLLATLSGQRVALLALLEALVGEPVRPVDGAATHLDVTAADEAGQPWEATWLVRANALGVKVQERFNTFDRLSWMPSVVAQGKASYNSNAGFANKNWIFDGIIAAEWALYDRGARYATLHENDAKTVEQRAKLEGSRARARATWIGAKTNLTAAQVSLEQAEAQAALATRAQRQVDSAFQAGLSTALEVSDIDSKRFLAASAVAQARAQLEVRKVELAAAEGRLAKLMGLADE